jgi:hypothetical protein
MESQLQSEVHVQVICDTIPLGDDYVCMTPFGNTLCGLLIRLEANGITTNATLGGLLMLGLGTNKPQVDGPGVELDPSRRCGLYKAAAAI